MPAQPKEVDGLRITVRDKRWWRRVIPFYTDYFKTSFWVDIERFEETNPDQYEISIGTSLTLMAKFPDGKYTSEILDVPESELSNIKVGGHIRKETEELLVAPAGQTQIIYGSTDSYEILFSYFVRSESAVMAGMFALIISLLILGGTLGGAVLGAWLQPDTTVVVQVPTMQQIGTAEADLETPEPEPEEQ